MKNLLTLSWLSFCLSLLLFSLGLSWQANTAVNFTYPAWYQMLDIDAHINKYAPQNKYNKQDFVHTDQDQHVELFEQVVVAINNHGENLDKIVYHTKNKQQLLFTQSEVVHLQDVSNLVDTLRLIWLINLLPLTLFVFLYTKKKLRMPSTKLKVKALMVSTVAVIASFAIFGFKKIFYYLHTVVFPENHQWFFYYQESLMSTFMKAPDLFAAIGIQLFVLSTLILFLLFTVFNKYIRKYIEETKY